MKFSSVLLAIMFSTQCFADVPVYSYKNCADQRLRLPLVGCATIEISGDFRTAVIRDDGEEVVEVGDKSGRFHAINFSAIPLAVPKKGYSSLDQWTYRSNTYVKVSRGKEREFAWQQRPADTIVVVTNSENDVVDTSDTSFLAKNSRLTFWYSEFEGVTAIAFPALGRQSGEVFYCVSDPCIFAREK